MQVWGKTGSMLYGKKSGSDYVDNLLRFKLFNKAALAAMTLLPFSPGSETIVVCNDWHTALLPVPSQGDGPHSMQAKSGAGQDRHKKCMVHKFTVCIRR